MQATVGFFTEQSAQLWFSQYGDQVDVIAKKQMTPKGDGSPHLIVKMELPDDLSNSIYPEGEIMDQDFEEFDGTLL